MKSFRLFIALAFVSALAVASVQAGDNKEKSMEKSEAVCSCGKDKDGKECGKDKECCCKPKEEKKAEEKK